MESKVPVVRCDIAPSSRDLVRDGRKQGGRQGERSSSWRRKVPGGNQRLTKINYSCSQVLLSWTCHHQRLHGEHLADVVFPSPSVLYTEGVFLLFFKRRKYYEKMSVAEQACVSAQPELAVFPCGIRCETLPCDVSSQAQSPPSRCRRLGIRCGRNRLAGRQRAGFQTFRGAESTHKTLRSASERSSKLSLHFKVMETFSFVFLLAPWLSLSSSSGFGKRVLPGGISVSFSDCSQQITTQRLKSRVKTVP